MISKRLSETQKTSYIVMFSPSYGGAEIRFFDIFTGLRELGLDIKYVAPSSLTQQLIRDFAPNDDIHQAMISIESGPGWKRFRFIMSFWRLLKRIPHGSTFHYPLTCLWPLHIWRNDHLSMSFLDCASTPSPFNRKKTSAWAWVSLFFTQKSDILSPSVFRALSDHSRVSSMRLTPGGTFILPKRIRDDCRAPTVCFFGRLVPLKGVADFFNVLPDLWLRVRDNVPDIFQFIIAGYGPLSEYVKDRTEHARSCGIPINFIGFVKSDDLLSKASVFLSLQEVTNYPSRIIAEALVNGCSVIVRDTGDSRSFGDDISGLSYCSSELNADKLAALIIKHINDYTINQRYAQLISESAVSKFGGSNYLDYFKEILTIEHNS